MSPMKVFTIRHPTSINLSTKQSFEELDPKRLNCRRWHLMNEDRLKIIEQQLVELERQKSELLIEKKRY